MARIRTIKPEFWSDEKLSECSVSARCLFIGLWSFADDEGRMEYQPARIRMQVFPCGSVTQGKLTEWLGELSEKSLIRIYVIDGKQYLDIPNFAKHQKINRPTASRLPVYSVSAHGELSEPSHLEGKGKGKGIVRENKKHKTPIPESFALDDSLRGYTEQHLPDVDPVAFFESFCGRAKAKGWEYVDWRQAFMDQVRSAAPNSNHWSSGQYPKKQGPAGKINPREWQ